MFYVILLMSWQVGSGSVVKGPENTAAIVNNSLKISCLTDAKGEVRWYYSPTAEKPKINDGDDIILPIFSNFRARENAQLLETDSVQLSNAGSISCSTSGKELFAELIVLTSHPECGYKTSVNETELYCSVGYVGPWRPSIQWMSIKGSTISGILTLSENGVSSRLIIPSVISSDYLHFVCSVFFPDKSFQPSWASNKPRSFNCPLDPKGDSENPTKSSSDAKHWIIIGFVVAACFVVLVIIVIVVRKQQKACKVSSGPDLVQVAEIAPHQNGHVLMNRLDHCAAAAAARPLPAFPDEEVQARDIVYAEVTVDDRKPHYMHDSPAWNNAHIDGVKSLQSSPAWSHNNGKVFLSKTNPRKEKPMDIDGIEYLDVSSVARIPVPPNQHPRRPPARLPSKSYLPNTYAAIDHTSRPPPPPPPEDE